VLTGEAGLSRQAPIEDEVDGLGGTAASLFGIVGNVGLRRVRLGLRCGTADSGNRGRQS
jgi:hypothetical protein